MSGGRIARTNLHVLLGKLGVDVNDPAFWELGLKLLDGMVSEAERLAAQL